MGNANDGLGGTVEAMVGGVPGNCAGVAGGFGGSP